ncbi:MAG: hypothetical protein ACUVWX_15210 [Kiritimatiellia bacterium]
MHSKKPTAAIGNLVFLLLNSLVFVILLVLCLGPGGCLDRARMARVAGEDPRTLGQDVYVARPPFVILVSKDFPKDDSFTMLTHAEAVFFRVWHEKTDDTNIKEAMCGIGDLSFSCRYSLADGDVCVRDLMLIRQRGDIAEAFSDFNADGTFDFRQTRDLKNRVSTAFVWYDGAWQKILGAGEDPNQDQYHKRLLSGQAVSFDGTVGKWVAEKLQAEK